MPGWLLALNCVRKRWGLCVLVGLFLGLATRWCCYTGKLDPLCGLAAKRVSGNGLIVRQGHSVPTDNLEVADTQAHVLLKGKLAFSKLLDMND